MSRLYVFSDEVSLFYRQSIVYYMTPNGYLKVVRIPSRDYVDLPLLNLRLLSQLQNLGRSQRVR